MKKLALAVLPFLLLSCGDLAPALAAEMTPTEEAECAEQGSCVWISHKKMQEKLSEARFEGFLEGQRVNFDKTSCWRQL